MVRFASELKAHHDSIDKKLCKGTSASTTANGVGECGSDNSKLGLAAALGTTGGKTSHMWPNLEMKASSGTVTEKISSKMGGLNTDEKAAECGCKISSVPNGNKLLLVLETIGT